MKPNQILIIAVKACTISFERPVKYLCDAWHVFPPKYEAWTHFNRPMPCRSEIGQSKSLFLLTVALLCFQAEKLPFSHSNGNSDWLTEWLLLYNYRIIYRLAKTKDLRFSTKSFIIILCNAANYPVSQVLDTRAL